MEGGSLFNSGFLGASFNWWIGQIADDSTWRDNILPGKFESVDQIPGWGRRYKVRIIGLHDQGETEIPSDQLPWAQVMYPVTAGGGQAGASQTPNLMQGNMVFGFFLDGQEQQVPVIMGVLGNNAQTSLATKIGDGRVTNTQPGSLATSGFAEGKEPYPGTGPGSAKPKVPDDRLVVNKPTPPGTPPPAPKPGVVLDRFGRDPSRSPTRAELNAAQSARAEADRLGETGEVREARIAAATVAATRQEAEAAASPNSPSVPGATIENPDAVHLQSNADTKRNDLYIKKTVMLSPCNLPASAMKGMQTEIDNLTKEIDKILHSAQSYIDSVSQILFDIQGLIAQYSSIIAKYMKVIFEKIFEFISKKINKLMAPITDKLFPNQRNQFLDLKEKVTEIIKCLFTKIIEKLSGQIQQFLNDALDTQNKSTNNTPYVPICAVEDLVGNLLNLNSNNITETIDDVLNDINAFLSTFQGINSTLSNLQIGNFDMSIASALLFENLTLDIFGCDLKPNCAESDYYTLQTGSGAVEEVQQPRLAEINKTVQDSTTISDPKIDPYIQPGEETPNIDWRKSDRRSPEEIAAGVSNVA